MVKDTKANGLITKNTDMENTHGPTGVFTRETMSRAKETVKEK